MDCNHIELNAEPVPENVERYKKCKGDLCGCGYCLTHLKKAIKAHSNSDLKRKQAVFSAVKSYLKKSKKFKK